MNSIEGRIQVRLISGGSAAEAAAAQIDPQFGLQILLRKRLYNDNKVFVFFRKWGQINYRFWNH